MSSGTSIDWNKVIKKEAIGIGGIDIGEVQEVNDDYITIRKGLVDRKEYNISKSLVEDFDGIVLRFKVNEFDLSRFEKISESSLSTSKNKVLDDDSLLKELSSSTHKETSTTGTTTVPLMAETLKVKKKAVEDKISITKESVSETKTVEIELMQETITIERRPVYDNSNTSSNDLSSSITEGGPVEYTEEISIPLKREEPVISKKPYVKKEVMVKKKLVTEIKTVSEDITHEEIKYDYKSISNKSE
jgi:uncharacterized protein (TIGR02271 family)